MRKSFKKLQVQTRVENDFSFLFLRETEEVETLGKKWWGKQSHLATSREDIREAHTILASWFTNSLLPPVHYRLLMSKLEVVKNYQSCSKEYNFNWCWYRTLPPKKKRFSIFENLLKTSGTTTKVLSCLKIPLTSMRFIASCENVVPRFQTSPILPFPPHTWTVLLIPLKKLFYSQCWRVLTLFFNHYEGLENKLTRTPLFFSRHSIISEER